MGRVDGKVAIITGAARGMGEADARRLAQEGAKVVVTDVLDELGQAVADSIGDGAIYRHLDVSDADQWKSVVAETVETFGGVDILVNNAGIANGAELHKFRHDKWQQIIDINLTGCFYGCQAVTEPMIARGGGSIINVSSIEGMRGTPWAHGYVAAKWGMRGLTKSVALELAPHGIRCKSLHPGLVRTPITEGIPDDMIPIPLGRLGTVEDVANFVLFLASDESSYATATEFVVDGGTINGIPHKQL